MASEVFDPRFPWITIDRAHELGPLMRDERTAEVVLAPSSDAQWAFVADHSARVKGKGLGDRIHQALDWAGFARCMPCAKRQASFNALLDHVRSGQRPPQ